MPRNDLKAYETLTARIPQALVDAVKQYASLHRCTVSEVIRDSLQIYLDSEHPARTPEGGQEVRQGQTEVIQEVLREVRQGQTEVIQEVLREVRQEVRRAHASLAQALEAATARGHTEVRHETGDEVLQGHTTEAPSVPLVEDEGQTEVLQGQTEVIPQDNIPPFDTTKYHLGKLCPRGHAYYGTGQSLRSNNVAGYCLTCNVEGTRARRQARRQAAAR